MSDSLTAEVRASIDWLWQDARALSTVADAARLEYAQSLVDGAADGQVQKLWHAERTIAASDDDDLVLTNLESTLFGGTIACDFAKIKALLIVNQATAAGLSLAVGGAGAGAFAAPFNGSTSAQVIVPPAGSLLLAHPKAGWTVTASTSDILRVSNLGASPVTYRAVLLGT